MTEEEINSKLINNDSLFSNIHVIKKRFQIIPSNKDHIGASIEYQDLMELRDDFIEELVDSVVEWVYSSEKYKDIVNKIMRTKGKSESGANSEIIRKTQGKFRTSENQLLIQGQLGELLLFHFIQRYFNAIPLLRKMNITTSSKHERFGADAIHYKVDGKKNIIILGEAKTYISKYKFNDAFKKSLESILDTYKNHRKELKLYVHEDFLDAEMDQVAESYLNNTMKNTEIHLVNIIIYNESTKLFKTNQNDIQDQIENIISQKFSGFDQNLIDIEKNPILNRITYIAFPVWGLESLANKFQNRLS